MMGEIKQEESSLLMFEMFADVTNRGKNTLVTFWMSLKMGTTTNVLMVQVIQIQEHSSCPENSCAAWLLGIGLSAQAEFEKGKEELKKEHLQQLEEFRQTLRTQDLEARKKRGGGFSRRRRLVKKGDSDFFGG